MQKDLDPLIDKATKKILSTCTEMLNLNKMTMSTINWHEIQQLNLLPKSELIEFVEENRPTAASSFIGKYCELSSSYYSSCAKGFFEDLRKNKNISNQKTILIGDPIEGDDIRSRRRSSTLSLFFSHKGTSSKEMTTPANSQSPPQSPSGTNISDISYNATSLLLELLRRESTFFREFLGSSSFIRRKGSLSKIFMKCFSIFKNNLKDVIFDNLNCLELLKTMSEITNLEVQIQIMEQMQIQIIPIQWLNELQNLIFEEFKRNLRKQIESLTNYSELKISLSSGELRHHFVVKRFSNFMKSSLEVLKTFQRPWEIVQVELKKLEHSFFSWIIKVSSYLKDKREILLFQINNFDLIIENCSSIAGADFLASLKFKFDPLIDKFLKMETERYFYDLIFIINEEEKRKEEVEEGNNNVGNNFENISVCNDVYNREKFSDINSKLKESFKIIMETFISLTFTDFSNFKVSQLIRERFANFIQLKFMKLKKLFLIH